MKELISLLPASPKAFFKLKLMQENKSMKKVKRKDITLDFSFIPQKVLKTNPEALQILKKNCRSENCRFV